MRRPDSDRLNRDVESRDIVETAGAYVRRTLTPTVRLGVTGLSRAGKTVFITALVRSLVTGGRLPFFAAEAEGRILSAVLEPQPDDAIPRFDYEAHLAALASKPPEWPESTRRISELRITVTYRTEDRLRRLLGPQRLNIDIVDYPGEWLIDLALLDQSFAEWSADALTKARAPRRAAHAAAWLSFVEALGPGQPFDDVTAIEGTRRFTIYLDAMRASDRGAGALPPGRFLMPGDLAGSPLLTFFPLPPPNGAPAGPRTLYGELTRRFEKYKKDVVKPFFREHFMRLDRQIVLIDVLGALSSGPEATADLEEAMAAVLKAFRPGRTSWLGRLFGPRVDRVLFAATKADHLNRSSHDRLESLLAALTLRASKRAEAAGADVRVMALAALRATREVEVRVAGDTLPCIAGIPLPGEVIDGQTFDGRREAVIFPGDLPADPSEALDLTEIGLAAAKATFVRFRPPRLVPPGADGETPPAPHIRLDRALEYLVGDRLA